MIASARMYAWTPTLTAAWGRLLEWVGARAAVPMTAEQSGPATLDELWARDDLGCVFMCGYPWALRQARPELLAAPVPSPARYGGRPVYVSDFVVGADSPFRTLPDTFGGSIAFSTEHSHSGYNAPRYHLIRYRTRERPTLYGKVLGPYVRQRPVLEAVARGDANVAAIDGYALDLLRRHDPDLVARVRVVETTEPAPSPPLVASPGLDPSTRARITGALLEAHRAPEIADTLGELLLTRFAPVQPADFQVFLDRERAAERAGYPKLG